MIEREDAISDYTRLPAKRLPSNTCVECVPRWHAIWLRRVGTRYINEAVIASEAKQSGHLTTRGLTPTEAGRIFYNRAKRSIEEADGAELTARVAAATLSGRLRVQATVAFGRLHVIPRCRLSWRNIPLSTSISSSMTGTLTWSKPASTSGCARVTSSIRH